MLFVSYWELRLDQSTEERTQAVEEQGLIEKTQREGVEILRWDITPSGWGILVMEADDAAAVDKTMTMWRAKQPWFQEVKVEPAQPIDDHMETLEEIFAEL